METANDYYLSWGIYLAAVLAAQLLLWRVLSIFKNQDIKTLIQLLLLALLITPVPLEPGQGYWVPAFMAAIMEGLNLGLDAALPRLWPIFTMMLVFVCLSVVWRLYRLRLQNNGQNKA
ncbi:hypothetical protein [Oceanicoccus sagamiensis]|uniref:Uncharacterized protein n=1 Tax=Oceanicoccus sagamiensis TaxID=716816 RepID=A0A1X9NCX1_9GAMM|nr:hypothetical protein [Oceanicoccus sagamiensis]ARN75880.1 hypothetical protein BST96_18290 [Oceanicoccus sagamiensis]